MFKNYLSISPGMLRFANYDILSKEESMSQAINNNLPVNLFMPIRNNDSIPLINDFVIMDSIFNSRTYSNFNYLSVRFVEEDHYTVVPVSISEGLNWLLNG